MSTLRTFKERPDTRYPWTLVRLVVSISLFCSVELMLISRGTATLVPEEEGAIEILRESFNQPRTADPCASEHVIGPTWITCSNNSANVLSLTLKDENLTGNIPAEIAKLQHMRELTISGTSLTGPLPDLNNMTSLITLDLSKNNLWGQIPDTVALTNISQIALNDNNLTGGIPASIFNHSTLQRLNLSGNPLGGSIPDMSKLTELAELSLIQIQINGSIPESIQSMASLETISLQLNPLLKGPVPDMTSPYFPRLKFVNASHCALSGDLPDFGGLSVEVVDLEMNDFSGKIPVALLQHGSLRYLRLSSNPRLSGQIPDMELLTDIVGFYANDCNLSGPVPSLGNNLKLEFLAVRNNTFTGFPTDLQNLTSLRNIDIARNSIIGRLPNLPPGSTQLTSANLQWLTFNDNHFSGAIPSSWYELTYLQGMLLGFNNLSGVLLREIGNLTSLKQLNLSNNHFSGNLPKELGDLTNLEYLDLRNNQFNGTVPETLARLTNLKAAILDDNNFMEIPESVANRPGISFENNPNIRRTSRKKKSGSAVTIGGTVIGACAGVGVVVLALMLYKRKGKRRYRDQVYKEDMPKSAQGFPLKQIKVITEHYKTLIGKGGFGLVYYGKLLDGKEVAVKVRAADSKQGAEEFLNEVRLLSRLHHRNLVTLLGYCLEAQQQILVYDFMPNGTLHDHLYHEATRGSSASSTYEPLSWKTRLDIAINAARGLEYLHKDCNPPIIHRDVKSSNILLTNKMQAKISDLGISKQAAEVDTEEGFALSGVPTVVKGTFGYLDPEYYVRHRLTTKSDVYSFGVVLLEIITGRRPQASKFPHSEATNLIEWVRDAVSSDHLEVIVDSNLNGGYDRESILIVTRVALSCVLPSGPDRPDMGNVARTLTRALQIEGEYVDTSSTANHEMVPLSDEQQLPLSSTSPSQPSSSSSVYAHPSWITDPR